MALVDQIVESHTRTDTAVGATSAALTNVTIAQTDGAGTTGRYSLHAAVAVSSSSAGVEITGLSFGSEDMAPSKSSETTTAGARPATRMFSAGEWPTGAQTPTVTVTGGNIDAVVVFFFVLDEVAEECLAPFGVAPRWDTFNRLSINPMWTLDQGDGSGATASMVLVGGIPTLRTITDNLTQSYFGARGLSLQQSIGNIDLDIALQKETIGNDSQDGKLEGLVVEIAGNAGTYALGSNYEFSGAAHYVAHYTNDSETSVADSGSTDADTEFPRLERVGNAWEFFESDDGSTFSSVATFNHTMTAARCGIALGGFLGAVHTTDIQQFINRNASVTRTPQDAQTALQFLSTNGTGTSTSLAFTEDTNEGAGLVNIGIIAASDAAGAITEGTGDELIASGLVSSTDGIRYAIVGALTEVSGTTSGTTIGGSWTGSAPVSMSADQYRVEALAGGGAEVTGDHDIAVPTQDAAVALIGKVDGDQTVSVPTQDAALTVTASSEVTADQTIAVPTQDAAVQLIGKVAAAQALPVPTQDAALAAIAAVSAAQDISVPVQGAALAAIAKIDAAQTIGVPTQDATLGQVGGITAAHVIDVPTQDAALASIIKATAAQTIAVPGQAADVDVIAKVDAAHALAVPTQDASLGQVGGIAADHEIAVPTQAAALGAIAKASGDQTVSVPVQDAALDLIGEVTSDQIVAVPTQAADVGLIGKITADQTIPVPSQVAAVRTEAGIVGTHQIATPVQSGAAKVLVKATSAVSIATPVQSGAVQVIIKTSADHQIAVPSQDAALVMVAAGMTGDHVVPVPTQSADVDLLSKLNSATAISVPSQNAALTVLNLLSAVHGVAPPTQIARIQVDERPAIGLSGKIRRTWDLKGSTPNVNTLNGSTPA